MHVLYLIVWWIDNHQLWPLINYIPFIHSWTMSLHATRCNFCFIHFMTISLPTCSACSVLFLVYWSLCSSVPHLHYIISSWAFSQLPYWLLLPFNASLPLLLQTCSICLCWFGDAFYYSRCLIFLLFLFLQWWINHPTSRCNM